MAVDKHCVCTVKPIMCRVLRVFGSYLRTLHSTLFYSGLIKVVSVWLKIKFRKDFFRVHSIMEYDEIFFISMKKCGFQFSSYIYG